LKHSNMQTQLFTSRAGPVRWVLFRAGAFVVVLLPLLALEVILRLAVPAPVLNLEDPYVSFSGLRSLFSPDSTGMRYETAKERLDFFCSQSFTAVKDARTFRIFCLGGSTVQGRPYAVETAFTTWLKLNLDAAQPARKWEVINCGGISYASYRLAPIMRELLEYEPDLFILYTGHNEFLEDRTYGHIKKMPRWRVRLHRALLNLRIYSAAHAYFSGRGAKKTDAGDSSRAVLPTEVEAKLDFEDGLKWYHRDDAWRRGTIEHFGRNLEAMVQMSQEADVPIILANPAANLEDCPPIKSQPGTDVSESQRLRVGELREQTRQLGWDDAYGKIRLLEQAVAIDGRDAGLLYVLGKCYARIGRFDEAKKWFIKAKDEDICPLRILEPMRDAVRDTAARSDLPLVDVQALIESRSDNSIAGEKWLLDHVHPSIAGHKLIADALFQAMESMELVHRDENWPATRDQLWENHLSSLDDRYYRQGAARLKRLQIWSRGRMPDELAEPEN